MTKSSNHIWPYALVVLLAVAATLIINPVGFVGGGQDDARYLEAAQCWAAHGGCLPQNHWQGRWPVFAPIALLIRWFGESRLSVQLWPFLCSIAALYLLLHVVQRHFGKRVALAATLLLLATPAFSIQMLMPSVEALEFAFALASILLISWWRENQNGLTAFAAGLTFGLAFQIRETALMAAVCVALFAYLIGCRPSFRHSLIIFAGFLLPLAVELLFYHVATGDMLYRRQLSLNHTRIPSSELSKSVDTSGSPILNQQIIGGWRREPGLQVHWAVDGPLNLLLNAKAGFSLLLTPLLLLIYRKSISPLALRRSWWLLGFAAAYIASINYVLAMDPKPRVMLIALAASCTAFAIVLESLWTSSRRLLAGVCFISSLVGGAYILTGYLRPAWAERAALRWIALYPQQVEIDRMTRMMMTLRPELRSLPSFEADRRYLLTVSTTDCNHWVARAGFTSSDLSPVDQQAMALLPRREGSGAWICLFQYRRSISPAEMSSALKSVWTDRNEALTPQANP